MDGARSQFQDMVSFQKRASSRHSYMNSAQAPDHFLLSFAHLMTMSFNAKPSLLKKYEHSIARSGTRGRKRALKVSLHIRSNDACEGGKRNVSADAIKRIAETTNKRKCYTFSAYTDALKRIHDKYNAPLDIHL